MKSKRNWMFGVLFVFAGAVCLSMISQAPAGERGKGRRSVPGKVSNVNTADYRISLQMGTTRKPSTQTYNVARDAKINVNGHASAKLSDVKPGMRATLVLNNARSTVVKMHANNMRN